MRLQIVLARLMLLVAAILLWFAARLSAADSQADVRNAIQDGLPVYAQWNVSGFRPDWTVEQIKAGHRIIPSLPLPYYDGERGAADPKSFKDLNGPYEPPIAWLAANNLPICLRMNNIAQALLADRYRDARPRADLPEKSPRMWRRLATGQITDQPWCDDLAPLDAWTDYGQRMATSPYLAEVRQRFPSPPYWLHSENHEGSYGGGPNATAFSAYVDKQTPQVMSRDGLLGIDPPRKWLPLDTIAATSVRLRDRVAQLGIDSDPYAELVNYSDRERSQYLAYYQALAAGQPEGWKGRMVSNAYNSHRKIEWAPPASVTDIVGDSPDARYVDSSGPSMYVGFYGPSNLTEPTFDRNLRIQRSAWEWIERQNPRAFRTVFLWIDGTNALKAALAGQHAVVDTDRYQAITAYIAWTARTKGRALLLQHWLESKATPAQPFFSPAQQDRLRQLGRPELVGLTQSDYCVAAMRALDVILDNPELREFWVNGETLQMTYAAGPVKVWIAQCVQANPAGDRTLIFAWTPLANVGAWPVKTRDGRQWSIDLQGKTSGYWIVETPAPIVPPPQIRKVQ